MLSGSWLGTCLSRRHARRHRRTTWVAATISLAAVVAGHPAAAVASPPWPLNPNWQSYVLAPPTRDVSPVSVVSTTGNVTNPEALTQPSGGGLTTLSMAPGGPSPVLVLDYGKETGGFPVFDVAAVTGTPVLRAAYSETLANMTNTGDGTLPQSALFLGAAPVRYEDHPLAAPGVVSATTIQGGERYELLTLTQPGTVTLRSVNVNFTGYLGTPDALSGHFVSSDDLLNRIWYSGIYTVNLDQVLPGTSGVPGATNADANLLIDGAKRDRGIWSGDLGIADRTLFTALDPAFARDSLRTLLEHPATTAGTLAPATGVMSDPGPLPGACSPTSPTSTCYTWSDSYSMLVMTDLYDYYRQTGDSAFVAQEWPAVVRQMAWDAQQVDGNGLVSSPSGSQDWNVDTVSGEVTWVNAVYYQALRAASALATAVGQPNQAGAYATSADQLKTAINNRLFNTQTGLYDASDTVRGAVVQDANVFAVLAGLPSAPVAQHIMSTLATSLNSAYGALNVAAPVPAGYSQTVSPFMGGYQLDAMLATGGGDQAALDLMRREWGWLINHDPGGTTWEIIPSNGVLPSVNSAAHAWSTGATATLTRFVLGVGAVSAGYDRLAVIPHPANLAWSEGTVPSPHGPIDVKWGVESCGGFRMDTTTPTGTTARLAVPRTSTTTAVSLDGATVWRANSVMGPNVTADTNYVYVDDVSAGAHTLEATGNCGN